MKLFRPLLSATEGLFDRLLCVAGVVIFTQLPEFFQQYLQRLGGHLDEARRQLAQFESVAAQSHLTVEALAEQTGRNADAAVAKLGGVIAATLERVNELEAAHAALQQASVWTRPFVFLQHVDGSIARATWTIFKPAVPTTFEGMIYGLVGMLVFLGLYHGMIRLPLSRWSRRRQTTVGAASHVR